jgi:hypothetical protein
VVLVTTYDRERRLGALYRILDGKPILFAGGRPTAGAIPVLRQPGRGRRPAGDVYVTDREQGAMSVSTPGATWSTRATPRSSGQS